ATEAQIEELLEHLQPGDTIIDGGNTNFHDDQRRHPELKKKGIEYIDAGVSGGIWGLANGFCLMVGGDPEPVKRLEPVFLSLAPKDGYLHVGGPGAGHYVKMVHNGIEYGLMQAYAEGFEIMHASSYDLDLGAISDLWMHGSVVRSWLLELAARAFEANGQDLQHLRGYVEDSGEGRGTIQEALDPDLPAPATTSAARRRARTTTRSARASASSVSPIRAPSSCSDRPAIWPIARSCPRSTSCGGRTSCRTSSRSSPSAAATTTTNRCARNTAPLPRSTPACCPSTRPPGDRSLRGSGIRSATS